MDLYRLLHKRLQTVCGLAIDRLHDLLAHARIPEPLEVVSDSLERGGSLGFGGEERTDLVGHVYQAMRFHYAFTR